MLRAASIVLALALVFVPATYVRRAHVPVRVTVVTVVGGSRDRTLRGKARIRARRAAAC